ncbi:MAG: glycogen synthase [Sandaracinaceae bacterium]
MRLLFITPDVTPITGTSPIGDLSAALPKALIGHDHEVMVIAPLYAHVDPSARGLGRRLRKVEATLAGDETVAFTVFDARTAAGVEMMFLGQEELFGATGGDVPDVPDGLRYGAFCRAAVEVARADEKGFDVIHAHGWPMAMVPLIAAELDLSMGTVLTLHGDANPDAMNLGAVDTATLKRLRLGPLAKEDALQVEGAVSLLRAGVQDADRVTTISPTYASEIRGGGPLSEVLTTREDELVGIMGGVDAAVWNPATDSHLDTRFDPMDRSGKRACKAALQEELDFPVRDDVPLVVAFGPLLAESGFDALARTVSRVMRADVQLAVLVEADAPNDDSLVAVLREHAKRWPDRMALSLEGDASMIHRGIAGADLVMLPPGATLDSMAIRAQRYGALPIGPRAGVVADSIVDCAPDLKSGTGFLYEATDDGLLSAVQRSVGAYSKVGAFEKLRARAMRGDHSWERAAYLYERIYTSVTNL